MATLVSFVCAKCGGTFKEGWTENEARHEFEAANPGTKYDDVKHLLTIVCDGCFNPDWQKDPRHGN